MANVEQTVFDPAWHEQQKAVAEGHWDINLNAMGVEGVRSLLVESRGSGAEVFGIPYIAIHPQTGRKWEFHPPRDYVARWLHRKQEEDRTQGSKRERTQLTIQILAVVVALLSAGAAVANAISSYYIGGQ